MRKRTLIFVGILIIAVGVMGLYLAPNHREVALMKMKDGNIAEAFDYYSTLRSQGDNSTNVLISLINLYVYYGNIEKAISLMETLIAENPRSIDGRRKLADLYKSSQSFYNYCRVLEDLEKLAPSADILEELVDTYDFLGLYQNEMQALARLVVAKNYKPLEDDYYKLAIFYRIDHDQEKAVQTLLTVIDLKKYNVKADTMRLATIMMLEAGEDRKALAVAAKYLEKYGMDNEAVMLSSIFREHGKLDSAYAMLAPFITDPSPSPEFLEEFVNLQLARGKDKEVYDMLVQKYKQGKLPETLSVALLDLSIKYKNYAMTEEMINTATLAAMPEDALVRYAELALEIKRPDIARVMQKRLGGDYLHKAPLVSAMLEIAANDTSRGLAELLAIPQNMISSPDQKIMIADIYIQNGLAKAAFPLLQGVPAASILENVDPEQFASLYLEMNEAGKGLEILYEARRSSAPEMRQNIDNALLFLAAGDGRRQDVESLLKNSKESHITLSNAYDFASNYHHNAVALVIAEKIFQETPTAQNRKQLADALLENHQYAEALKYLEEISDKDAEARAMYFGVMGDWIHEAGIGALGDSNREALNQYLYSAVQRKDMTVKEKSNLAYLLEEAGLKDKAQEIFLQIASNRSYNSPEVSELLDLWGDKPPASAVAWMEVRAQNSNGDEKSAWLTHLNEIGHQASVLKILEGQRQLSKALADEYLDALAATHSKHLSIALSKEIDGETLAGRLKKLAHLAENENLTQVSEKAWRKLYEIDPSDSETEKNLGLLAYDENHYSEAKKLLEEYLKNNKADYRVNYAYAEILNRQEKKDQAKTYFAQAEEQLSVVKEKDISAWLDEANLLYRNNRIEESLELYRKLLARHPENKTVRADFAEVLIETKKFDEASLILSE